jgi:aminodeoxyfutalosine deaminase
VIDGLSESAEEAIRSIAKAELHVHLEGSLAPDVTLSLARKHRVDIGAQTVEGVRDLYRFTDFAHFLRLSW